MIFDYTFHRLIILCEVAFQNFCPFIIGLFATLLSWNISLCTLDKSALSNIHIVIYFLLVQSFPFIASIVFFNEQKFWIFMKSSLEGFFFSFYSFSFLYPKESLSIVRSWRFSLMFSFKSFRVLVLDFTFMMMIPEINYVIYCVR